MIDGARLVPERALIVEAPLVRFPLGVGDRPVVAVGDMIEPGAPLAVRTRDVSIGPVGRQRRLRPGARRPVHDPETRSGSWAIGPDGLAGEILFSLDGDWWATRGSPGEEVTAPIGGVVRSVRPGIGVEVTANGRGVAGAFVTGEPVRGTLASIDPRDDDLRASSIDVGRAGTILVVDGRVDAEVLIRARAIGVRGIVVGGLSDSVLRDLAASVRRHATSAHRPPSFAVLALDGSIRRPIADPVRTIVGSAIGTEVAIVTDPPLLVVDAAPARSTRSEPLMVRIVHGPLAGRTARWVGPAGLRRFRAGVHLEAAFVAFADGSRAAVPLGDLERHG